MPFGGTVRTFLFMAREETLILPWRPREDRLSDALHRFDNPEGMLIIYCDAVFGRIMDGLGFKPHELRGLFFQEDES